MRGFSATLGNPPFINAWKQHEDMEQSRQFLADQGENFLTKHWDLSAAFLLQAQRSAHGAIGMILPTSLLLQPHGMPVRRFHVHKGSFIVDWTGKKWFRDASVEVYSSVTNRLKAYDHYQQLQGPDTEDLLTSPVSLS